MEPRHVFLMKTAKEKFYVANVLFVLSVLDLITNGLKNVLDCAGWLR